MTWLDYLLKRGYLDPKGISEENTRDAAIKLLSYFMTYPTTLAYYWDRLLLEKKGDPKVCIVGAETESANALLWNELLCLMIAERQSKNKEHPTPLTLTLDFVGPRIAEQETR